MSALRAAAAMDAAPVGRPAAAAIEAAEARAWEDMYGAAPPAFARAAGIGTRRVAGALVLRWAATGRRYFSRAIGLGVAEPATPEAIDAVLDGYRAAGITMFLVQSLPHCEPPAYEDWLRDRGLEPFDAQDRIVRDAAPLRPVPASGRDLRVERVTEATADEWAEFLQGVYRLDTGPWLQELRRRPRWHQYVVREGVGGAIVAARGMFLGPDGLAWLGMDGPVPGIMTDDHEPDTALCAAIVADGLARGACGFLADIEAPSADLEGPAYERFAALGFRRPYLRTHWTTR
ncbi:MAG: hypothetical protein ACXVFN_12040 [Solirubrobacteraceae bacterium]